MRPRKVSKPVAGEVGAAQGRILDEVGEARVEAHEDAPAEGRRQQVEADLGETLLDRVERIGLEPREGRGDEVGARVTDSR